MKRARLIYNPTSGREQIKRELPDILNRLEALGYEASSHATTGHGDAIEAARIAVERRYDLVIAAGGDGTINEVVNGIAEQSWRPKLALLPTGTTNDFARALHIPRSVDKAMEVIEAGHTASLDIGKVNDTYFVNIAGAGKLTELTYEVPSKLKTVLGQLAYYLKGVEMLPFIKPSYVEIEYDGKLFEGEVMLFLVSNSNSIGGFEKLAPDALLNDGMFELIILKKTNVAEFIRIATLALRGEHIKDRNVLYTKASRVKVKTKDHMQLNLDGEYGGDLPGEFENLYRHIEMIVPADPNKVSQEESS
ncbi:diacylglycerol kinase [Bacillaceae bacterium SIJ1]|uniref:diacylglycerol kinase n=1 Tax=Litoribacterium kuwaitense TaxID=1398745 RepID=UPI0013EC6550|nr:diacylglycerol kinase [Litoribacterium kuwaitense]NGP46088.1 diacylglycerol kinase [Litoribacterium kuwaitense]